MSRRQVCFLIPYPLDQIPSQRFRFEQYLSQLRENGLDTVVRPFLTEEAFLALYQSGNLASKIHAIASSYVRRYLLLFQLSACDFIFIHREATPAGPPIAEYVIARILKKKIIYDFDDAIWLTDRTGESLLTRIVRCRWKVGLICRWSQRISCGNAYLADYARKFNPRVIVNPTTIDTFRIHVPLPKDNREKEKITIGWTGSRSTLKYLATILPVLQIFERKYPQTQFLIIADADPKLRLRNAVFRRWARQTEIADIGDMDIGIMPLPDDPWTRGKGGFKALQYMALEIPALVSPVAVNQDIVEPGVEGYWCRSFEEWFSHLEELAFDPEKRKAMGKKGRQKVVDQYSVASNSANFLSLFR